MKIIEIVCNEAGDQRMLNEEIVRRPIAQEKGERIEIIIKRPRQGGSNKMTGTNVAGDLLEGLPRRARFAV